MIYVAGPFFTDKERMYLAEMIDLIKKNYPNEELFIPMEHFVPNGAELPNDEWAREVFKMDVNAIDASSMVIALYLGHYSDTGTAWEIGYAYAKGIPVYLHIPKKLDGTDMSIMPISSAAADLHGTLFEPRFYNQK